MVFISFQPSPQEVSQAIADIRQLISLHGHEHRFNGRAVARIFHGISSPCFPAQTWGRARRFWRSNMNLDFNFLVRLAVQEIIKLRWMKGSPEMRLILTSSLHAKFKTFSAIVLIFILKKINSYSMNITLPGLLSLPFQPKWHRFCWGFFGRGGECVMSFQPLMTREREGDSIKLESYSIVSKNNHCRCDFKAVKLMWQAYLIVNFYCYKGILKQFVQLNQLECISERIYRNTALIPNEEDRFKTKCCLHHVTIM